MNDMTDAQVSKALALAIGWQKSEIIDYPNQDYVGIRTKIVTPCVRFFSYKFPAVIFPIAERFDCFPAHIGGGEWRAYPLPSSTRPVFADTAAKAVALAVIKHREGSKTRSQLLREAGFTRRPSVRSLPSDE